MQSVVCVCVILRDVLFGGVLAEAEFRSLVGSCRIQKWNRKSLWCWGLGLLAGRGERAAEGGMLSCFNLCQWPLQCGGDQSSGPSVFLSASSLTVLIGAAGGPARPVGFFFLKYKRVCVCVTARPYQCCIHPLKPYQGAPLPKRRVTGRPPPPSLLPLVPFKEREQLLVKLPVFMWCEFRCSMKDSLCLFPSP